MRLILPIANSDVPLILVAQYTPQTTAIGATMISLKVKGSMTVTQTELKESTKEFIAELVENNYYDEDIYNFIEQYGEDSLVSYYESYCECGEEYNYAAVDAFCSEFGVENIDNFQDAYYGEYETPEIFAENYVSETQGTLIPDWIVIDWEATWKCNLQYDFSFAEGFIFYKNF